MYFQKFVPFAGKFLERCFMTVTRKQLNILVQFHRDSWMFNSRLSLPPSLGCLERFSFSVPVSSTSVLAWKLRRINRLRAFLYTKIFHSSNFYALTKHNNGKLVALCTHPLSPIQLGRALVNNSTYVYRQVCVRAIH